MLRKCILAFLKLKKGIKEKCEHYRFFLASHPFLCILLCALNALFWDIFQKTGPLKLPFQLPTHTLHRWNKAITQQLARFDFAIFKKQNRGENAEATAFETFSEPTC